MSSMMNHIEYSSFQDSTAAVHRGVVEMTLATSIMKTKEGLYTCLRCGYQSPYHTTATRHYRIKHQTLPKMRCPLCGKLTINEYSLAKHTRKDHNLKLSDLKAASTANESAQPAAKKIKKE